MNLGFILLAAVDCLPVDEWVAQTFLAYFRGQLNDLPQGLHLRLVNVRPVPIVRHGCESGAARHLSVVDLCGGRCGCSETAKMMRTS